MSHTCDGDDPNCVHQKLSNNPFAVMNENESKPPSALPEAEEVGRAPVVFLDIDGVLLTHDSLREGGSAFCSRAAMKEFNRLLKETDAEVVISSSWRILRSLEFIRGAFCAAGFHYPKQIIDVTEHMRYATEGGIAIAQAQRADEIREWLSRHTDRTHFVIFDDDHDADIEGHYIRTTFDCGLTARHVDAAIAILRKS